MRTRTRIIGITASVAVLAAGTAALVLAHPADSTAGTAKPSSPAGPSATPTPSVSAPTPQVPPLTVQGLAYVNRTWGDPKTELGVIVPIPSTWSMAKVSTFESRFTSPNKLWTLRLDGVLAKSQPRATYVAQKLAALKATPDFRLLSQTDSAGKATSSVFAGLSFQSTTLTYTYTDPARGTRLVLDRFVTIDKATDTGFEVATSGRPEDLAALRVITDKATLGYVRLP